MCGAGASTRAHVITVCARARATSPSERSAAACSNFSTSSGTIGAALEAALCGVRGVAVSFAYFRDEPYTPHDVDVASRIACRVIRQLWEAWPADAQLFNINVPLYAGVPETLEAHLTHTHVNRSGPMFRRSGDTSFAFAPDFASLLDQPHTHGSDNWAVHTRVVSITPLRAAYAEVAWPASPFPLAAADTEAADVDVAVPL